MPITAPVREIWDAPRYAVEHTDRRLRACLNRRTEPRSAARRPQRRGLRSRLPGRREWHARGPGHSSISRSITSCGRQARGLEARPPRALHAPPDRAGPGTRSPRRCAARARRRDDGRHEHRRASSCSGCSRCWRSSSATCSPSAPAPASLNTARARGRKARRPSTITPGTLKAARQPWSAHAPPNTSGTRPPPRRATRRRARAPPNGKPREPRSTPSAATSAPTKPTSAR